jgi:uncharacterized membrane protein
LHLEASVLVSSTPEKVYAAYTDFESMPKWSKRLTAVRVARREGDLVHLENEAVSSDGSTRRTQGAVKLLPGRVESESETRFTRSRRIVTFTPEPGTGGTRVTASFDVEVKGLWGIALSPRVRKEAAEASAQEELASFARYVEGSTP